MQKRRRIIPFVLVLFTTLLLAGCFEGTFHVTVNEDGSADLEYKMGFNEDLIGLMGTEDNPLDEAQQELVDDGFTVSNYTENGMVGILAQKHVDQLETIPAFGNIQVNAPENQSTFRVEENIFQKKYLLNGEIDLSAVNSNDENAPYAEAFLDQMKLNFILTLPTKIEKHNATSISEDGHTLTWVLVPGTKTPIQTEATTVKSTRTILMAVCGIVILLVMVIALLRSRNSTGSSTIAK